MGANGFASVLAKVVSLLSTLLMVRLLSPDDFGLMALATTVTGLIGFFNEIGIGAAITQRPTLRDEEVNGCFGIALIASAALCAVTFAASWPAAAFFNMPALQPVLAALAFSLFFGAVNTVPTALLRRELRFQAVLWSGFTAVVVQSLVAIGLAWLGYRHWAIVIGFFVGQTVATVWYWRVSTWRPSWPMPLRDGRALLGYGLNVTYTRILWHAYSNVDKLIIGKLMGAYAVGVYDVSRSLANIPTTQISGLVVSISGPVFARVQGDKPRLQAVQLRLVRGVAYITFPALLGIALLAEPLVAVLLGPTWRDAVVPLQALCIAEMVASIATLQSQLLIATGHVKRLVRYTLLCTLVMPTAIAVGAWADGLRGVALAWMGVYPLLATWLLREALNVSGASWFDFRRAVRQPLTGAVVMAAALVMFQLSTAGLGWPALAQLAAGTVLGVMMYAAYLILIDHEGVAEIRQVLGDVGVPARWLERWPFVRSSARGA